MRIRAGVRTGVAFLAGVFSGMLGSGGVSAAEASCEVVSGGVASPMGLQNRYSPVRFRPAPLGNTRTYEAQSIGRATRVRESVRESAADRFFSGPPSPFLASRIWL